MPYSKFLVGYYFSTPYAIKQYLSARCIPKLCIFQTFEMTTSKLVINGLKFAAVLKDSTNNSVIVLGDSLIRNFDMAEIDKVCLPGGRCEDFKAIVQSMNYTRHRVAIFMFGGNDLQSRFKGNIWRQRLSPQAISQEIMEMAFYLSNREVAVYVVGVPHRGNSSFGEIKELNCLLFNNRDHVYTYVGLGTQMSKEAVVGHDGVHLTEEGLSRLKTIFKKKILNNLN